MRLKCVYAILFQLNQYVVVCCDTWTSVGMKSWLFFDKDQNQCIRWPKRAFTKGSMHLLIPNETWMTYRVKKFLGVYGKIMHFYEHVQFMQKFLFLKAEFTYKNQK